MLYRAKYMLQHSVSRALPPRLGAAADRAIPPRVGFMELKSIPRTVADVLVAAIVAGTYAPGEQLVERNLALELGVSNIVIREAFALLVDDGLVVRLPRRGAFVRSVTPDSIRDLTRVRVALEQLVVELAIERWTADARRSAQVIVEEMRVAAEAIDADGVHALDTRFHELFWEVTGSEPLLEVAGKLKGRIAHFIRQGMEFMDAADFSEIAGLHQQWVDAVDSRNVAIAKSVAEHHITQAAESIVSMLEKSPVLTPNVGDAPALT
jgi:DNA-binding GntR family transcriptional regulator